MDYYIIIIAYFRENIKEFAGLARLKQRKNNALFQIVHGTDTLAIQADFKVAVVSGRIACAANLGDDLSFLDGLA